MEFIDRILLITHIVVGFVSLFLFWFSAAVRKGGNMHIQVGRLYQFGMWTVLVTAVLLSLINLIQGFPVWASFLGYLAFLTGYPLWYSIAIIRHKKGPTPGMLRIRQFLNIIIFTGGVGMIIWNFLLDNQIPLLLVFGIIGTISSSSILFRKQSPQKNWLTIHIEGIIGTGIAAHTAFFAFGGSNYLAHIFTNHLMVIPWVLPTVIGIFMTRWTLRKWALS